MTFGRAPGDHHPSASSFGVGGAPAPGPQLDAPYAGGPADGFGGRGSQAAAPATPGAASRLAAPPAIDFGEAVAGEHPTRPCHVFNLHPTYEAYVAVSLTGSPELALVSAPDRLRPSHEGLGTPIVLMYQPTARAESRATLKVSAQWQTDVWPATTIEIPVTARAYAPGEKTHAEEATATAAATDGKRQAAADLAREGQLDAALARENRNPTPYPQGDANRLDAVYQDVKSVLATVTAQQRGAVDDVGREVDAFHRKVSRSQHGLLFNLAMFALDAATAGIAGSLAAGLSKRVSQLVRLPPRLDDVYGAAVWSPARDAASNPPEAVALVVESFKQGFKQAGKAGREAAFSAGAQLPTDGVDSGETIDFFSGLASAVNHAGLDRELALIAAHAHLLPTLRAAPDVAVATMEAMHEELLLTIGVAKETQKDEARLAWMRFLSQHALGSLDARQATALGLVPGAGAAPITDVRGAEAPPREGEPMARLDGVLDLEFEADYVAPEGPVTVKKARMTGVHARMVETLLRRPLRELGLVIRAHGTAPGAAVLPVTVVRDEAGNIRFTDETGAAGQPSTWLSRKGGSVHASPERQRLGAVKLMDELLDQRVGELVESHKVDTDHQEQRR